MANWFKEETWQILKSSKKQNHAVFAKKQNLFLTSQKTSLPPMDCNTNAGLAILSIKQKDD